MAYWAPFHLGREEEEEQGGAMEEEGIRKEERGGRGGPASSARAAAATPRGAGVAAAVAAARGIAGAAPTSRAARDSAASLRSRDSLMASSWGPATVPAEPRWEDGVVVLALAMRTPADTSSEIKGSLYGIEGITPGYLEGRRSWEDVARTSGAGGEDEAGTSGGSEAGETGTWKSVDDDGRFPSLINLFLRHGGSLEMVQELIRGVKARTEEELEQWLPGRICL